MDSEQKKLLSLIRNKGALTNGVPTSESFVNTTDSLEAIRDAITTFSNGDPRVHDVIVYPVAPTAGTTELTDDGTSPAYYPAVANSTTANAEGTPGAVTLSVDLEQEGTITVLGFYVEFEWQTKYTAGGGDATQSSSKIQISRDGGASWVDVTENFNNASVAYVNRIRAGIGQWVATIVAGASQLQFRLAHWTNDSVGGGGRSSSEAQVRSNSYVRVIYRKS